MMSFTVRWFAGSQVRKFAGSKPPAAAFQVRFVRLMAAVTPFAFGKSNRRATPGIRVVSWRMAPCALRVAHGRDACRGKECKFFAPVFALDFPGRLS